MSQLFSPLTVRGTTFKNRIGVSPMCQYAAVDGVVQPWHLIHVGSRAVGGAGTFMIEASGVAPEGRITPSCVGIWNDHQAEAMRPLVDVMATYGCVPAIQLAHAGRKASASKPWDGGAHLPDDEGGWSVVAPSAVPFDPDGTRLFKTPIALSVAEIADVQEQFVAAAKRAVAVGFKLIEIHAAHGYLLHSFTSPISNRRDDGYGGDLANRARMLFETTEKVRAAIPEEILVSVRLSLTDWSSEGITLAENIEIARGLKARGVDFIDGSSGGSAPRSRNSMREKGAEQPAMVGELHKATGIQTMAVGEITTAARAEQIIADGWADLVLIARQFQRDPYFPYTAARELGLSTKGILPTQNDFFVG